jgi:GH18 family chitinase
VADAGGNCPSDTANSIALMKELRLAMPAGGIIAIDSQAAKVPQDEEGVKFLWPYVDYFHLMTYDYSVPDLVNAGDMSPNMPLYNPPSPALQMSINYTIQDYLVRRGRGGITARDVTLLNFMQAEGVPASKIMVGVAMYGHVWYNPGLTSGDAWQAFGNPSLVQVGRLKYIYCRKVQYRFRACAAGPQ